MLIPAIRHLFDNKYNSKLMSETYEAKVTLEGISLHSKDIYSDYYTSHDINFVKILITREQECKIYLVENIFKEEIVSKCDITNVLFSIGTYPVIDCGKIHSRTLKLERPLEIITDRYLGTSYKVYANLIHVYACTMTRNEYNNMLRVINEDPENVKIYRSYVR